MAKLNGVINTKVGYCGGHLENPIYEMAKNGDSGHAESVWIEFDDTKITLK